MANDQDLARHLMAQNLIQESHWQYWLQCREAGDRRAFGVFLTEQGYLAPEAVSLIHYQLSNTVPVPAELPTQFSNTVSAPSEQVTQFIAPVPEKMLKSKDGPPPAIGGYRIVGTLGRGGFGVVYEGKDENGNGVAIKVLIDPTVENLPRFEREQRLVALFGLEQGFVPLLETGIFDGGPYFVMPLMTGGSLKDRVKTVDYSLEDATELLLTLGRAVALAHNEGVVHRDLKPDNILFDGDGRPFISDLGLAKHFSSEGKGADQSVSLSVAGEGYGTPGYMAPEQMKSAKDVGPEADVFALGSLFFYCLTRRIPFHGQAVFEIAANVIKGERISIRSERDDCPASLHGFINRCLEAEPEDRFADAEEFVEELELVSAPVSSSRRSLIVSVISALLLVLFVSVGLQIWISSSEKRNLVTIEDTEQTPQKNEESKEKKTRSAPVKVLFETPKRDMNKGFKEGLKNCRLKRVLGTRDMSHLGLVTCCSISSDGRFGASGGFRGHIKVFEIETGKTLWEKQLNSPGTSPLEVHTLAFKKDSRTLFIGAGNVVRIWDWVDDEEQPSLTRHTERILSLQMSDDGRYCATSSKEATYLWELKGLGTKVLRAPTSGWGVRFTSQDSLMIAGQNRIILWDYLENKIVFDRSYEDRLNAISGAVTHDGESMIIGHYEKQMSCWSLSKKKLNWRINALTGPVTRHGWIRSVLISKDEREVISGGGDGQIHFWDLTTGELNRSWMAHASWVHGMALHPDGRRLLTVSNDQRVRLWDIKTETMLWRISGHASKVLSLSVSNNGKKLLSGSFDTTARIWDLTTGKEEQTYSDHDRMVYRVAWSKDGTQHVTVGQRIYVYETGSGQRQYPNTGQSQANNIHFGQKYIYVTSLDGMLFQMDPKTIRAKRVSVRLPNSYSVTESPGAVFLAVGGLKGGLCLLEISKTEKSGFSRKSEAILAHRAAVTGLRFLKDDKTLLTCSMDGFIKAWDTENSKVLWETPGHAGGVMGFAISADEQFVISVGGDATFRIWRLRDGTQMGCVNVGKLGDIPYSVAASPVKNTFYVGLSSGAILEYEITKQK